MGLVERGAGQMIYKKPNDIAVRVESIKEVKGVSEDCKFEIAVDHTSYFADPKGVSQLEQVLLKINQKTFRITPSPAPIITPKPVEPVPSPIVEAGSLGFLSLLIQWLKKLF